MMKRKTLVVGLIVLAVVIAVLAAGRAMIHMGITWNLPLSGRVIVLDPGHGGADGGAEGGSVKEKDLTLIISRHLRNYLEQQGAIVLMTRDSDRDLAGDNSNGSRKTKDLMRRAAFIEEAEPDAFISVHMNAIPSPRWRGAQTFYHPKADENRRMAWLIQDSLRTQLENTSRLARPIGHVYLLKTARPPSALVEVGFLSNPEERALLLQSDYQKKVAAAISQGVTRYFTNEKVPSDPSD